jgi:serine/threonine-protein kinase
VGREAAVKLVRPELLASGMGAGDRLAALRRFEREANATAGLHSPHTVALYNYGLSEDGLLYYVMELLDGFDLETLVTRFGPMPAPRAVHVLLQVCDSLDEAHRAGLLPSYESCSTLYANNRKGPKS